MNIIKKIFTREFVKFVITGIINTLSTTVFATIMDCFEVFKSPFFEKINFTFIIGYIFGLCISFLLNTYFTFREKPTLKKALRFPLSYIPNFLIQYIFVWMFEIFGIPLTFAYLCAAILGIPVTFIVMRVFVYAKKD